MLLTTITSNTITSKKQSYNNYKASAGILAGMAKSVVNNKCHSTTVIPIFESPTCIIITSRYQKPGVVWLAMCRIFYKKVRKLYLHQRLVPGKIYLSAGQKEPPRFFNCRFTNQIYRLKHPGEGLLRLIFIF
jgi:hypothetical protein